MRKMRVNFDDNDVNDDYDNENKNNLWHYQWKLDNSEDGNECRMSWLLHKVKDIDV